MQACLSLIHYTKYCHLQVIVFLCVASSRPSCRIFQTEVARGNLMWTVRLVTTRGLSIILKKEWIQSNLRIKSSWLTKLKPPVSIRSQTWLEFLVIHCRLLSSKAWYKLELQAKKHFHTNFVVVTEYRNITDIVLATRWITDWYWLN